MNVSATERQALQLKSVSELFLPDHLLLLVCSEPTSLESTDPPSVAPNNNIRLENWTAYSRAVSVFIRFHGLGEHLVSIIIFRRLTQRTQAEALEYEMTDRFCKDFLTLNIRGLTPALGEMADSMSAAKFFEALSKLPGAA